MRQKPHQIGFVVEGLHRRRLAHQFERDVETLAALVQRRGKNHLGHPARAEAGAKQVATEAPRGDLDGFFRRQRCQELTRAKLCTRWSAWECPSHTWRAVGPAADTAPRSKKF